MIKNPVLSFFRRDILHVGTKRELGWEEQEPFGCVVVMEIVEIII